ncbi:secreted RxLR effector peptide protein, putative [Phytophthora infestans T30-4]|uniref:RxLR effector protein n=1 Tax=Phytophthora infestans (strain T30-4) TaxID=403677 RepID=D0NL01_PHYIT|nr:secreted RxLR effector peptide protein, putative [Phytophthora infestans T30-4]EEY60319.1 secreted RxLR effector peptide protein, putative [Phytophthora infestans T30-4]|eukprot:XP_002900115.1 secreted RxLR effector peptide protein, putative [Phytophthora infestans T30-4]
MRLTYILAMVFATTLYSSGTALQATTEITEMTKRTAISPNTVVRGHPNGERQLRRVGNDKYEADEERGFFGRLREVVKRLNASKEAGKTTTQKNQGTNTH